MDASGEPSETGVPPLDPARIASRLKPLGSPTRIRLLRFLVRPHYLEEIAGFLGINRSAAERHVRALAAIGLVRTLPGRRDTGPVRDFLVAPDAFFELYDAVRTLGEILPAPDAFKQTLPGLLAKTKAAAPERRPGQRATPFPFLVVVYGAEIGRAYPLTPKRQAPRHWTIGRDSAADIPLESDPFVSTRHARVLGEGADRTVADTYSTNGTWINWERLPEGEDAPLRHGDILGIGKTLFVFRHAFP